MMLKLCILLLIIVSITTSKCNGGFEEHFLLHRNDMHLKNSSHLTKHLKFSVLFDFNCVGKVVDKRPHVKLKCCLSLGANLHKNLLVVLVKVPSSRLDKGDCRNRSRKQQRSDSTQNNSPNKKINFPAIPIKMCL